MKNWTVAELEAITIKSEVHEGDDAKRMLLGRKLIENVRVEGTDYQIFEGLNNSHRFLVHNLDTRRVHECWGHLALVLKASLKDV